MNSESAPANANHFLDAVRNSLSWVGQIAGSRAIFYLVAIAAGVYGVILRSSGLGRSLWLDEAWVANSISAHSLGGMFYYDDWLQSSPPLFLILVRTIVAIFGLSNMALRAVPSALGIAAILIMFVILLRILSRQYALLAWLLLVLSPVTVTYSRMLKQYSAELAATTAILLACVLYIEKASIRRFWLLVAIVSAGLLSGYAVAFLLPGVAFMVWMSPNHNSDKTEQQWFQSAFARAIVFSVIAAVTLIGEYYWFVIPNSPAVLHAEWAKKHDGLLNFFSLAASESYQLIGDLPLNHRFQEQTIRLAVFGFTIAVGIALALLSFLKGRRNWLLIQIVCLLPCLSLSISDWFNWYPFSERTSLFAVPCLIVAFVGSLQLICFFLMKGRRGWSKPLVELAALGAIVITLNAGWSKNYRHIDSAEDMDGATSFLKAHVQHQDFLWVHASTTEAFKLYATMKNWHDAPVHFGHTAWPCCARGVIHDDSTSSEALVRVDFGGALPRHFSGRVWLLYTTRPEHWHGMADEPQIMQAILRERGCTKAPIIAPAFNGIAVIPFDCQSGSPSYFASQLSQFGPRNSTKPGN